MELDKLFGIHAAALKVHAARSQVLANNIANADTPGFQAKDIDFKAALTQQMDSYAGLKATHEGHLGFKSSERPYELQSAPSDSLNLDKNTVNTDIEKMKFMENAIHYQANAQFLNGKIQRIMKAIKGE